MRKKGAAVSALFLLIAVLLSIFPVYAEEQIYHPELLVDRGGLLTPDEIEELSCKLFQISQDYQFNVAIVTERSIGNYDIDGYAKQVFTSSEYGYENTADGILLVISMNDRKYSVVRDGYGYDAFSDGGLQYIVKHFVKKLSSGDYYKAFNTYADLCEKFLKKAKSGKPYTDNNLPHDLPSAGQWAVIVGLGGLLGVGVTLLMKRQLHTVRRKTAAGQYVREGSFRLTGKQDIFLYSHVSRTAKPKESRSSGGGSSSGGGGSHSGPSGISGSF